MDDYCDPDKTDEVIWNQTTALTNAKEYWTSKFGLQSNGSHIVLAPHTLRLMNCCSIAVDRYCVVIGKCENKVPSTSSDHTILDLPEHPEFSTSLEILRQFLQDLDLKKTYTFHIEQPFSSHKKFSHATVLAAVWKFICYYEPNLDTEDIFITNLLKAVNNKRIPISISEIRAIVDGSLENGFFSYFINDMYLSNGSGESSLETENVQGFFSNYDFVYLKTNMSNINYTRDFYTRKPLMNSLKRAFKTVGDVDPRDDQYALYDDPFFVGNTLSSYSRTRLCRREFPGNEYENVYQKVVDKLTDRADKWIRGGEVQPGGILLVTERGAFQKHDLLVTLAQTFFDTNATFGFISLEVLRPGAGIHSANQDDLDKKAGTMKSVRPTEAFVASLHNFHNARNIACDTPQHYLLDDSRSGSDDDTYIEDSEILM